MKKEQMPVCGYCYAGIKDVYPTKIISNMTAKDRCRFCKRLCYGYIVEIGEEDAEDNTRRPANYKGGMSSI